MEFPSTIKKIHNAIVKKQISCVELVKNSLKKIEQLDKELHAFLFVDPDNALKQAEKIDKKISNDQPVSVLAGIPCSIKDILATKGVPTTAASKILQNFKPSYDATVVKKLKDQDMVMLGKTNLDEFAHGASTENSAFGPTKNPKDTTRVPGGSSGGSAAAVASGMGVYSIGTDTGGSIRQPASFCGVVGLKPTYGRCSRYGLLSMTSSTDCAGTITNTVEDSAIVLQAIAGKDDYDSTTVNTAVLDYSNLLNKDIKGLKIGLPKEYFIKGLDAKIDTLIKKAVKKFEDLGAQIIEVSLPHTKYGISVYYVITPAEISANLSRYDGVRFGYTAKSAKNIKETYFKARGEGFGPEAKRRILIGTFVLSSGYYDAYYSKAQKVRTLIIEDFKNAFSQVDILLTPTTPNTAFKIGEQVNDPLQMYLEDVFVTGASIAGLPALSVPCGQVNGLPVGMQLIGNYFKEEIILRAGHQFEVAKF